MVVMMPCFLFGAALDMFAGSLASAKQSCAFEDNIDAQITPRQFGRVTFGKYFDAIAINDDVTTIDLNGTVKFAVRRVVARKVGIRCRVTKVVQRHYVELAGTAILVNCPHHIAADAAVAVDSNFDSHDSLLN
jgi:hypothetical protein